MKADLILKSHTIFNGKEKTPFDGIVAIKKNQILYVGKDTTLFDEPGTKRIDCGSKLIMPAFIDAHTHYFQGAISSSDYMCTEIASSESEEECVEIIKRYAQKHPGTSRICGLGWFPAKWNDAPVPTKKSLDAVFPDRPIYLMSADSHTCWLNSRALEEAGITPDQKPRSGSIGIDENGELTGLLFEPDAYKPAWEKMMDLKPSVMKRIHQSFIEKLNSCGITSVSEMTADDYEPMTYRNYESVRELENQGELTCRLHLFGKLDGYTDFSAAVKLQKEYSSEKLRFSGVKGLLDGVTSTFTGLLLSPYADKPETCGIGVPLAPRKDSERYILAANKAGLPVRLHCIADGSVRMALDFFEKSLVVNGNHGLCNTIEHIETIHPDDIPRFAELNVIPSMQPYHLILDSNEKVRRLGEKRCQWEWPHKSLFDHGGQLAFGTDYPVVDCNPFANLYAAITRCDDSGAPTGVNPQEKISLAEALIAYTGNAARVYSRSDIGVLEKGKLADVIVIDRNLFEADPMEIRDASVELTIMDGTIVYEK